MGNSSVNNHTELTSRIVYLRAEEDRLEEALRDAVIQYISSINPVAIAKQLIHVLARDKQVQWDLLKISAIAGAGFLADKISGRKQGIAERVGSVLGKAILSVFVNGRISDVLKNATSDDKNDISEPDPIKVQ